MIVCLVKENGEIQQTISPTNFEEFPDGGVWGDLTVRYMETDLTHKQVIQTRYWKDGWKTRAEGQPWQMWNGNAWVANVEVVQRDIKQRRNELLRASDWTMLEDAPVDKNAWKSYRAELRKINPGAYMRPDQVNWPTEP